MEYLKFGLSVLAVLIVYNLLLKPILGTTATSLVGF